MNWDNLDIDQQAKEHEYNNAQPKIVKYEILLKQYDWTYNTWNALTERYSDSKVWNKGKCIRFEGTEEEFDDLYDKILENKNNKVIGVYNV